MKIELRIRVPSDDFPNDILIEFESFFYYHFEDWLEVFPTINYPKGTSVYSFSVNIPRRELFKTISSYHYSATNLLSMVNKYEPS